MLPHERERAGRSGHTAGLDPFDAAARLPNQADIVHGRVGLLDWTALADGIALDAGEHVWYVQARSGAGRSQVVRIMWLDDVTVPASHSSVRFRKAEADMHAL